MDKEERRRYLTAEHKAYLSLIEKGYSPQGADDKFENIVVFKIENKNTNNEKDKYIISKIGKKQMRS